MTPEESNLVQAAHLARKAYLYVRQSSPRQVAQNTESTRRQYALRERAEALGWSADQVEVIDCDQGISGTSAADRHGFQQMVTEVSMGRVGLVIGLEVSRLARNCSDWHRLLELCAATGTLILDQDGLYDPTTFNHQILLGIKGFLSAVEVGILRARLRGALLQKAARGELRIGLPVGFIYDDQGQVCLHPDVQVQKSIRLLFETFRRTSTAGATVKHFGDTSLLFPRPAGRGSQPAPVLWKPLDLQTVVRILHNPRYAGAFVYGRRRTRQSPAGKIRTQVVPHDQWHALVLDAHEGYIDWDEFQRNEQQLKRSALAYGLDNRRAPPREGPALLQGLVLCGVCGGRMTVRYHDRSGRLVPDYQCITGRMHARRPLCQVIPGASVDRAVGERLVAAMTPKAIELSLAVRAELQARLDETDRLRLLQVERASHEAELARRRYMQVDPDNRLVATTLEADWNVKLRALAQQREQTDRQRAADRMTFDQATETRVRALAEDFPSVFNDPATAHRDRKRMAQLLIDDVTLVKTDTLNVHIRFKGGATESLVLPLPENAWLKRLTHPDVVVRIEQLLEHHDEKEIAECLNAEGLVTGAQRPFNADAVRWVRYTHGLKTSQKRLYETGKLTATEMAARLGMREETVRQWARDGRLHAQRHGCKPTWLIDPIDEQSDQIQQLAAHGTAPHPTPSDRADSTPPALRARIDKLLYEGHHDASVAERLNSEAWHTSSAAPYDPAAVRTIRKRTGLKTLWARLRDDGKMSTPEMAVRLGIGLGTVTNWLKAGRLRGRLCGKGPRPRWLLDPIDQQPEPIRQLAAARANMPPRRGLLSDARCWARCSMRRARLTTTFWSATAAPVAWSPCRPSTAPPSSRASSLTSACRPRCRSRPPPVPRHSRPPGSSTPISTTPSITPARGFAPAPPRPPRLRLRHRCACAALPACVAVSSPTVLSSDERSLRPSPHPAPARDT
jgi:DNA invertase Pin-like site-specific DNA recombinase/DNA-binding transcriptional regulator YiaG